MSADAGRPRAFVVEDEAPIRELLRVHLELARFTVEEAGNRRDALDRGRGILSLRRVDA